MKASWMPAYFLFSSAAIAGPLCEDPCVRQRLQRREHDAGVGGVGEAGDRQAGERHRALDARLRQRDVAHLADHFLGAVERGAVGQSGKADQILLILARHEAARHLLEQHAGDADQEHVEARHRGLAEDHLGDGAAIILRGAGEDAVEAAEEPAEPLLHDQRQPVLRLVMALQQQRRQRGRQSERVDRRDHGRDRDRERELLVELPGEAGDEGKRHEHRDQHQRDRDDRPRHLRIA